MSISFFVPGIPRPGGSKKGFAYAGKDGRQHVAIADAGGAKTKIWRAVVALAGRQSHPEPAMVGALRVVVVFRVRRPRGHYGSGKNASKLKASAPAYPTTRPDATKLWRSTEDALTGILWQDDAQIVLQAIAKEYADDGIAGVKILVERMNSARC